MTEPTDPDLVRQINTLLVKRMRELETALAAAAGALILGHEIDRDAALELIDRAMPALRVREMTIARPR